MFSPARSEGSHKSTRKALKLHFNALVPKPFACIATGAALKSPRSLWVDGLTRSRGLSTGHSASGNLHQLPCGPAAHPGAWSGTQRLTSVAKGFFHTFFPHCGAVFGPFLNTFSLRCHRRGPELGPVGGLWQPPPAPHRGPAAFSPHCQHGHTGENSTKCCEFGEKLGPD